MAKENIGQGEDLELHAADAENVVGGKKAKKKVVKKPAAKKPAVKGATTVTTATSVTPSRPMTQEEMDAYDDDMVAHGLSPVYRTEPSE